MFLDIGERQQVAPSGVNKNGRNRQNGLKAYQILSSCLYIETGEKLGV
jgi:hypothetical protein